MENPDPNARPVEALDIPGVVRQTIGLYRNSAAAFLGISFLIFLFAQAGHTITYLLDDSPPSPFLRVLNVVLHLLVLYFQLRLLVALYLCAMERLKGNPIDIRKARKLADIKFWSYIGVLIAFLVLVLIPGIMMNVAISTHNRQALWAIFPVSAIFYLYLSAVYGFAPQVALFEDQPQPYFRFSKALVQGDTLKVMLLIVIVTEAFRLPGYIRLFHGPDSFTPTDSYLAATAFGALNILVTPFTCALCVVAYSRLRGKITAAMTIPCKKCGKEIGWNAGICPHCETLAGQRTTITDVGCIVLILSGILAISLLVFIGLTRVGR